MGIIWAEVSELTFKPIEVKKVKYRPISDVYTALVKDLSDTDVYEAELITLDKETFYLSKYKDQFYFNESMEIKNRGPVINQKYIENFKYASGDRKIKFPSGKLKVGEYEAESSAILEVDSYSDAFKGVQKYYFYIDSVKIEDAKLTYSCSFASKNKILNPERVVAHHKTIEDYSMYVDGDELYTIEIPRGRQVKVDMQNERAVVKRIMEVERMMPEKTDTKTLTAIARVMLACDDPIQALSDYKTYLKMYMPIQRTLKK